MTETAFKPASALVLDFGGVISKTMFETHAVTEDALGLARGTLMWRGPFAPSTDDLWRAMQRDEISEREYWNTRSREVGLLVGETWTDVETLVQRARGADVSLVIRPEAAETVRIAHAAGKRLAILSNELDLFYGAEFRTRVPFISLFDEVVDATYTKILKPDPRAYKILTDRLGLPAESCVFVDDQQRNIDGAAACGLQTVHFDVRDPLGSYREALTRLGIAASDLQETHHA
jgi:putative hydrolase of the HAD superfamily